MFSMDQSFGDRLKARARQLGLSDAEVARRAGIGIRTYGHYTTDSRFPKRDVLIAIARALEATPNDLLGVATVDREDRTEVDDDRRGSDTSQSTDENAIPEIDVRAGMGGGGVVSETYIPDGNGGMIAADDVRGMWSLPGDYLRSELRVDSGSARIIEVQGDSMEPTLRAGDRVMVDTAYRLPSPPGVFALWDGFGVVVKRIEHVPNSDPPVLRVKSDNKLHDEYERTADEVNIIGRVVWYARRV